MIIPGFPMPLAMQGGSVPYLPIPAMTSNTTPAGWEAFASSQFNATYAAWKAFDKLSGSGTGYWRNVDGVPSHIGLYAPSQFIVAAYAITVDNTNFASKNFELQGSNDGLSWDVLDAQTNVSWGPYQRQQWAVASPSAYNRYRLVDLGGTSFSRVYVGELELLQEDDL
jgi:hypothetical protein